MRKPGVEPDILAASGVVMVDAGRLGEPEGWRCTGWTPNVTGDEIGGGGVEEHGQT